MTTRIPASSTSETGFEHTFVRSLEDFPPPVGGVITLPADTTWELVNDVDLQGNRLVAAADVLIKGQSSENCRLSSTGLTGTAMITGTGSVLLRDMQVTADIALSLTGDYTNGMDFFSVNFIGCTTAVGTITDYTNCLWNDCVFIDCGPLTYAGTFDTISHFQVLVVSSQSGVAIQLDPAVTITRRFRMAYCAVVVFPAASTGIAGLPANFSNLQSFILNDVNFSGSGTFVSGLSASDNEALIRNSVGLLNSADIAQYYMIGNATSTTLTTAGTFYKIAGTTSAGSLVSKFTLTDNRATYDGALIEFFQVSAVLSFTGKANDEHAIRVAKNGTTVASSEMRVTLPTGGRTENILVQDIVELTATDYLEIWVSNLDSSSQTATISELNVIVKAVK